MVRYSNVDKAEKACKDIMDIGAYSIEDSYSTNFDIKNKDSKENIFVILYDRVYTSVTVTHFICIR